MAVKGRAFEKGTNDRARGYRELRGEKHLKSLPVSLTLADSIGRAHISPYTRYCFVHEQKTSVYEDHLR